MGVEPARLSIPQLQQYAKSLEEENQVLTANFQQLKMAQAKFLDAATCMRTLASEAQSACAALAPAARGKPAFLTPTSLPFSSRPADKDILVPLTSSLYAPGVLDVSERVLVDIGTSFYVGKTPAAANELLARKAALLKANTDTLYRVILEKRDNLEVVARTLEQKQAAEQAKA